MRIISPIIFILISLSSFSQNFELEVSNNVFRNIFHESDDVILERKSSFNINSRLTAGYATAFGKVYLGIGYSTYNYTSYYNLDEFNSGDPAFEPFETTRKSNGHRFLEIPLGIRLDINESIYFPIEAGLNIELEDQSNIFKEQFIAISTGIGFMKSIGERIILGIEPNISFFIEPIEYPDWTSRMPLTYGLRLNFSFSL